MTTVTGILPPRYRSATTLGRGGMAHVYRAHDYALGRDVAIKILDERYTADEGFRARFRREALAAARLSGKPYIVTIFDVGEWNGRPYIVMEHVSAGTVADHVRTAGPVRPAAVLRWVEQAAFALDTAHAHGVVHRDVKPANL
jgi:serine/threonine-protein kinase